MTYSRYRSRGASPKLQDVLARAQGKVLTPAPVVYSSSDIRAAKTVLDRLLSVTERNEIASIKEVPRESDEI